MLFMSVSCLRLSHMAQDFGNMESSKDAMVEYWCKKFAEKDSSMIWKVFFQFTQYSHVIMLASLYYISLKNLDNMRALTFMIFFTFYTASENLYRKTSWILSFYLCVLIYYNYYNSLLLVNKGLTDQEKYVLKWYNLLVDGEGSKWPKDMPIYFRHNPDV